MSARTQFSSDAQWILATLGALDRVEFPKFGTKLRHCKDGTVSPELLRCLDAVKGAVDRLRRAVQAAKKEAKRAESLANVPPKARPQEPLLPERPA